MVAGVGFCGKAEWINCEGTHEIMTTMGIGQLWKPVVNVTDLGAGEIFYSELSGLTPIGRHGDSAGDRFSVLRDPDGGDEQRWLLLQLVPSDQSTWVGGTHLDFQVADVAAAVLAAEGIGARIRRPAAGYPEDGPAYLEWAVMEDPWGNPFCLVKWPLDG